MKFKFYALKLSAIMIFIFLLQFVFSDFTSLFLLNQDSFSELWRFVTAIFLHGGFLHLLYNLFALALFGSILEKYIGSKKFLFVFFVTGIFANLISINYYDASLGASGAIFGLLAGFALLFPNTELMLLFPPIPIKAKYLIGGYLAFEIYSSIYRAGDQIAHLAHVGGAIVGIIIVLIWRKRGKNFY